MPSKGKKGKKNEKKEQLSPALQLQLGQIYDLFTDDCKGFLLYGCFKNSKTSAEDAPDAKELPFLLSSIGWEAEKEKISEIIQYAVSIKEEKITKEDFIDALTPFLLEINKEVEIKKAFEIFANGKGFITIEDLKNAATEIGYSLLLFFQSFFWTNPIYQGETYEEGQLEEMIEYAKKARDNGTIHGSKDRVELDDFKSILEFAKKDE